MKDLLEYIVPNLVNYPEEVEISEQQDGDQIVLTIKTNPEDVGRVIGKSGKVIKAIRQIARIMAIKKGVRVAIDVLDSRNKPASKEEPTDSLNLEDDLLSTDTQDTQATESSDSEGIDL